MRLDRLPLQPAALGLETGNWRLEPDRASKPSRRQLSCCRALSSRAIDPSSARSDPIRGHLHLETCAGGAHKRPSERLHPQNGNKWMTKRTCLLLASSRVAHGSLIGAAGGHEAPPGSEAVCRQQVGNSARRGRDSTKTGQQCASSPAQAHWITSGGDKRREPVKPSSQPSWRSKSN